MDNATATLHDEGGCADEGNVLLGFGLATAAGMMTFVGAFTVFIKIRPHMLRLASCFCLASASGVMAYVSLYEVLGESVANFEEGLMKKYEEGRHVNCTEAERIAEDKAVEAWSLLYATLTFFAGWLVGIFMDWGLHRFLDYRGDSLNVNGSALPMHDDEHEERVELKNEEEEIAQRRFEADHLRLIEVGWFTALALTLHNIPEGLLTYTGAQGGNDKTAYGIAMAIALHNIPEGFAVAMPIYIGTQSREKAIVFAGITGFAEPLGAAMGWLFFTLRCQATDDAGSLMSFGVMFGLTAGIMTQVAIKALFVEATRYDPTDRIVSKAWALGALVIAISLVVIAFWG